MSTLLNKAANVSASGVIKAKAGTLRGVFVASGTGTIKFWDSLTAANPVLINTFTVTAGTWYEFGQIAFATGLFITITGTVDCTVAYD